MSLLLMACSAMCHAVTSDKLHTNTASQLIDRTSQTEQLARHTRTRQAQVFNPFLRSCRILLLFLQLNPLVCAILHAEYYYKVALSPYSTPPPNPQRTSSHVFIAQPNKISTQRGIRKSPPPNPAFFAG